MNQPSSRLPIHYGWVIVLCGTLTLFCCLGLARFAFGMLLPAMRASLDLAYDQMGFISTANFAGYLGAVALAPWLIRSLRPRSTIVAGLVLIALCMFGISRSSGFWPVLLLYSVTGVGSGLANIPAMVLVSHWFRRRQRGRAAGLMIAGNGLAIVFAGFLVPALNAGLGEAGWRTGWVVLGVISLVAALVGAALLRNDPEDLGLEPCGEKEPVAPQDVSPGEGRGSGRILALLGLLYLLFGATYMVYGSFIVTTMVEELGLSEVRAGRLWAMVGAMSIFSGVLFGTLSDRLGRRRGLVVVFTVQTAAYLLAGSAIGSPALECSVLLYGISAFAIPTIMAAAVGDYLGLSRAAAGFAAVTFCFAAGQTAGPALAGLLAEGSGSFTVSYLASALLTALGALLAFLLPAEASRKKTPRAPAAP